MAATTTPAGRTYFGTQQTRGIHGSVAGTRTTNQPGLLYFNTVKNSDGTQLEFFLWVDENGKLRILNAEPVDQNADGTIVGTQS